MTALNNKIPCTECRKRKDLIKEHKDLQSEHRKLGRKMAHRLNKIADQEDDIRRLRASVAGMRNEAKRVATRQSDLLADRDELRRALRNLKKTITKAMEDSHLG
jgi:seryl-tRNA synthetase